MNRPKNNSLAYAVRSRIRAGRSDRLWTYADFSDLVRQSGDRMSLAAELSRLTKKTDLTRIRRGVYYRPKNGVFGKTTPDPVALADATLRARGERVIPTGIGIYNRLGLTTQVSNSVSRATMRRVPASLLRANGVNLYAVRRPVTAQKGITSAERAALDALRDVDRIPGSTPADVVSRLRALIRSGELNYTRLTRFALVEPPRVRALLGAIGDGLRESSSSRRAPRSAVDDLSASLNPLTSFAIAGLHDVLPTAAAWRIK